MSTMNNLHLRRASVSAMMTIQDMIDIHIRSGIAGGNVGGNVGGGIAGGNAGGNVGGNIGGKD